MKSSIENKLALDYWVNKLRLCPIVNDRPLEIVETDRIVIPRSELSYFNKLTGGNEAVEFTVLLSIYNVLLQRYFESSFFIASSGLTSKEESLLYSCISTESKSFKQCLNEVKSEVQEVLKYSKFEEIAISQKPFWVYTHYGFSFNGNFESKKNNLPFYLNIDTNENSLSISILYDQEFASEYVVNHFLGNVKTWLLNLQNCIESEASNIQLLTDAERNEVLNSFNNTHVNYPKNKTIIDLFEDQVEKTPDNVAVEFEGKQLSYNGLNEESNQLAHYLRENYTIQADDLIAIKLERSEQLLITILGVLKSGAAYVPIDTNYPKERINYIEKDSDCKVVIDEENLENFRESKDKYGVDNLQKISNDNHLAYVIYTSGTTGKPKGVMLMHSNAVAMLNWASSEFDATKYDVAYAATSHCFDLSIYEMFYPLSVGKKVKLFENALAVGEELQHDKKVLINTVPSSIRNLIESGVSLDNASYINLAGEPFPVDIARKLLTTNAEVRNLYGPSEDTTYSTTYTLSPSVNYETSIPIGKPISNSFAYILDGNLEPLPIGIVGKLYVSGAGVTKGYLNKEELTSERFIDNPFIDGEIMYDTGDLAKWMLDGNIEFLGRKDSQIKIRGYRIELEEIESTIAQFSENIQQVVLHVDQSKKEKELVAYYVSRTKIEKSDLREFLLDNLPSYMVPSYYMALDAIPLTPNGKIDKKSLPEITSKGLIQKTYVGPRNEVEKQLVNIWQEVLDIDKIGINDNFFELGGHSLLIGQIINRVYKQLDKSIPFKSFFKNPIISELSKELTNSSYSAIPKAPAKPYYPLTTSQHRIWVLNQLEGGSLAYNMSGTIKLKGNLEVSKFEEAFKALIIRYEILRTNFRVNESGEIHQYITNEDAVDFNLREKSLINQSEEEIEFHLREEQAIAFDLENDLLLRGKLFKTKKEEYLFSFTMHHIIGDGWSMELLISEVISTYNTLVKGLESSLPKLDIQYSDYAVWLQSELDKDYYKTSEAYWLSQFKGELPILNLPSFKLRPKIQTYNGNTINHSFSTAFLDKLKSFAKSNDVTLFMTLMSGINSLLYRYTNQDDIIIGTPIAGREHPDLEGQMGLYLNTLAIRTRIEDSQSFSDILETQKDTLLSAYENQNYPFDELINKLNLKRDTSRSGLFDVMVVLQNQTQIHNIITDDDLDGIQTEAYEVNRSTSQFDISFTFIENESLDLCIEYNTDIYDEFLIERMFTHFENLVSRAIDNSKESILSIPFITEQEENQILVEFNDTNVDYPNDKTINDLFEEQVVKTPKNTALVFGNKQLSYTKLNEKANQLAGYLRRKYSIQPNDFIGVKLDRNEELLVAILGILKSGGAYVPIDITYPQERINYIENDIKSKTIIDSSFLEEFEQKKSQFGTENPQKVSNPNHLAYVIYTSGTTGNPKGVMIKNSNLIDYALTFKQYFNLSSFDSLLQQASISFDTSVEEIFPILISGGKLVVIKENNDFDKLYKTCEEHQISLLSTNPYALEYLNQNLSHYESLNFRILISGGDTLNSEYISNLYKKFDVYNTYGPTESTVCATYHKVDSLTKAVPIGKPIPNRNVFIINERNILQPVGVFGELCISGAGLALGYLNKDGITKEKFVNSPFSEGNRMYKSGDLSRWLPDGSIEFSGRKDSQVKIRGYRIELGEIENTITQYSDDILQVVLNVDQSKNEKELVAYYVSKTEIEKSALRGFLLERLPTYMVPRFYMALDAIPLTHNGKIDKKSLPGITLETFSRREYVAPGNDIEKELVAIWKEVLGIETIGVTDNFFELGGHSLKITKLRNLVNKKFDVEISFNDLFIESTIQNQSKLVKESSKSIYQDIPKLAKQDSYKLSSAQLRIWMLSQFEGGNVAYNMPGQFLLDGVIDIKTLEKAFHALIDRHEVLRTRFKEDTNNGEIRQIITSSEESNFDLEYEDTKYLNATNDDLKQITQIENNYNFDLANDSLIRAKLIKIGENKSFLIFVIHHIVCDGWSLEIIASELFQLYNAFSNDEDSLHPLAIQYKEYASWEQEQLSSERITASREFWEGQFQGENPVLELPTSKERPKFKTFTGKSITRILAKDNLEHLKSVCQSNNSTLFMGLLAVVKYLLYKYSNQNDIVIGTPVAGREHALLQNQIGVFINTLALRTKFEGNDSFETLLKRVRETTVAAFEHQLYPFDKLVGDLPLQRNLSRNPLFDVMVTLQNTDNGTPDINVIEGLLVTEYASSDDIKSKFDIEFVFEERYDELEVAVVYNSDVFDAAFIEELHLHFNIAIESCTGNPTESLYKLPFLTKAEEIQLIYDFNDTAENYNVEETVLDRFREQVSNNPTAVAVIDESLQFSYEEFDTISTQIAIYINSNFESESNAIGVMLDRSASTIALLLGILKSGRAYIPLDPTFPIDRLKYIIEHSGVKALISSEELSGITSDKIITITANEILAKCKDLQEDIEFDITGNDTAYIIYTSGSTGNPKGVEIGHQSLLNFLLSMSKEPGITNSDSLFAVTTYSFDISVLEFFAPLISGASVYIVSNETLSDPTLMIELLEDVKPTIIQATPSFYQLLFNAGWKGDIQLKVLCGGDALSKALAEQLLSSSSELWNMYGPTETTIWSSIKHIKKANQANNIGKPIANTSLYVLDEFMQLCPMGSFGILFIGGDGLAKGYYNQDELTAQRFVNNPFLDGLIYDTGDIVKWNEDGDLIFLGRNDNQVKIRGYRIELGDIEAKMNNIEGIDKAIMVAKKDPSGDSILVAYFMSEKNVEINNLRSQLKELLPYYMIPSQFIRLDAFPLTPNKKINRKELMNLNDINLQSSVEYIPASSDFEIKLVILWKDLLNIEQIGVKDNFFDLGGHSLSVTKLASKIQKEYSIKVSINKFFEYPILEDQAILIENILLVSQNNNTEEAETEFESFSI